MENTRNTPAKEKITYHFAPVDQATGSQLSSWGNQVINPNGSGSKEKSRQQKRILDCVQGNKDSSNVNGSNSKSSTRGVVMRLVAVVVVVVVVEVVAVVVIEVYQIGI